MSKKKGSVEKVSVTIKPAELNKLKVLADFMFFDEYQTYSSFARFEETMKLFFVDININLSTVFRQLVGTKRKFMTFPRLVKIFLMTKANYKEITSDTKTFFNHMMENVIKSGGETILDEDTQNTKVYTSVANKKRDFITKAGIITNEEGKIRGITLKYDDVVKSILYDEKEEGLVERNKLELEYLQPSTGVDEDSLLSKINSSNQSAVRDSISHIFGTYTNNIKLLGFKTRAGKIYYEGEPKGAGFLYGEPNKQFHCVKFELDKDTSGGITNFQPTFKESARQNDTFNISTKNIDNKYFKQDKPLLEENNLANMTDPKKIEEFIFATPVLREDEYAADNVKKGNEENDLGYIVQKDEKEFQKGDPEEIAQIAGNLKINDILDGKDKNLVRKLKGGRGAPKRSEKDEKRGKRKRIEPKGARHNNAREIFNNKSAYKDLKMKLADNIGKMLDKEKDRLNSKVEGQRNMMARMGINLEEIAGEDTSGKPTKLRAGKKKSSSGTKTAGFSFSNPFNAFSSGSSPFSIFGFGGNTSTQSQGFGGFGGFGGYGGNSSSSYGYSEPTQPQSTGYPVVASVEDFFDCFGANSSKDQLDQLNAMSNFDLMKLFYDDHSGQGSQKINKGGYGYDTGSQSYGYDDYPSSNKKKQTIKQDPEADRRAQKNWRQIKEDISKKQLRYVLQTMGAVIKATVALEKDEKGERPISLNEKIRLYQILEENENIIEFLSQKRQNVVEQDERKEKRYIEDEEEIEEELDGLLEIQALNMDQINARMQRINEIKKTISDRRTKAKLDKIYDACVQRKNKLIKEEEERTRQEMIRQQQINEAEVKRQEEERRRQAEEEKQRKLQELLEQKNAEKKKKDLEEKRRREEQKPKDGVGFDGQKEMSQSEKQKILNQMPDPRHIYRNQQLKLGSDAKDPLFPPEQNTLCEVRGNRFILPPDGIPDDIDGWEKYTWARAKDIFGHNKFEVFAVDDDVDDKSGALIEDDDIIQGTLGDCYFLSAIAALAGQPAYIERLFYTKERQDNGAYGVYYCVNGEWKMIVIDDWFPCLSRKLGSRQVNNWVFSKANGDELWVMMLEKAWAKINGNYARIGCGGQPHEVFEVATDAWSEAINLKKPKMDARTGKAAMDDEFWEKLMKAQEQGFIMTAGTGCTDETEDMGLATGHAYTVSRLYDFYPNDANKRLRLVNIRNPWGSGEWRGDYCDKSKKWTADIKSQLESQKKAQFEVKDDGEFFMTYEDFCDYYVVMGICHINKKYEYKTCKVSANKPRGRDADQDNNLPGRLIDDVNGTKGPILTKLKVMSGPCDIYLRICQKNKRYKPKSEDYHEDHVLQFIMLLDSNYNYIMSESNNEPTTCIRETLQKGTYYIVTDINYRYVGHDHGYVISAYSDKEVQFEVIDNKRNNIDINKIVRNASGQLIDQIYSGELTEAKVDKILKNKRGTYKDVEKLGNGEVEIYSGKAYSERVPYMIMKFKNTTNNTTAEANLSVTKSGSKEYEIYCDDEIRPNEEKFTIVIGPGEERVVLINKYKYNSRFGLGYGMKLYSGNAKLRSKKKPQEETEEPQQTGGFLRSGNKKSMIQSKFEEDDIDENQVFYENCEPIDNRGLVNNYYMQTKTGCILGIDNNTKNNLNMKLDLDGLAVSSGQYKGESNFIFQLPKGSRKTFRTKYVPGATKLSFLFTEV